MQETKRKSLRQKKGEERDCGDFSSQGKEMVETDGSTSIDFKVVIDLKKKRNLREEGYGKI